MTPAALRDLIPSWTIHLASERKSPDTIGTYLKGLTPYLAWCEAGGWDPLARASLKSWTAELLEQGRTASTARTRMMPVRYFAAWLAEEGEIEGNPFLGMSPPQLDDAVIPVLSEEQLRALIAACGAPAGERAGLGSLRHRRDEAIVRLMSESGMRAGECLKLAVGDVDMGAGQGVIRRGKGGKGRLFSFGVDTAKALDRYLRVRRLHRLAGSEALWLGDRGRGLAYGGLYWALTTRAESAGIADFHPHMLRHTQADRWLAAGGSESGLMANNGWSTPAMLQRYGRANRERRAMDEARRLNLGEL